MSELTEEEAREPTLTYVAKLEARIKMMDEALLEIIELYIGEGGYRVKEIARAALAPEQEK